MPLNSPYSDAEAVAAMGAKADDNPLNHDKAAGVPSGVIAMWHGTIANIPSGWVICDGNNGTPNLLARFIEGVATALTNPGTTGGSTAKTTAGHTHTIPSGNTAGPNAYGATRNTDSSTDSIADIRPLFYDIAFIMKT